MLTRGPTLVQREYTKEMPKEKNIHKRNKYTNQCQGFHIISKNRSKENGIILLICPFEIQNTALRKRNFSWVTADSFPSKVRGIPFSPKTSHQIQWNYYPNVPTIFFYFFLISQMSLLLVLPNFPFQEAKRMIKEFGNTQLPQINKGLVTKTPKQQ